MTDRPVVWDRTTRLLHWAIALMVVLNLFVIEGDDSLPHQWVGYVAFGLVLGRIFWGFCGGEASRFRSFPLSPRATVDFLRDLFNVPPRKDYPGHNPVASWTYLGIWLMILALGVSGWMMTLDAFWGDELVEEFHEVCTKILQALLLGHFAGMTLDAIKHRRLTWFAMIRGHR